MEQGGAIWSGRGKRIYMSLKHLPTLCHILCCISHTASAFSVKLFLKFYKRQILNRTP